MRKIFYYGVRNQKLNQSLRENIKQTQVITNKLRISSTKNIPQPINEDAKYNRTKSEESEIQYSASPSANSLLEDDTSKQMPEDTSDISDITSNSGVQTQTKPLISAENYEDIYFDNDLILQSVKEINEEIASQLDRIYDDSN
ncbi:3761_t:CDS:2 [Funneliformis mosseae]|uniref:3761_t:CDS:1 n=1 Tax=Funneliformis mosseae TaxID=27381 RepID=A0A9N9GYQ9_FUNMO|nr:3761_t:CDS:2 [Funneliformis mosseae]